jgi:hypothetical protein
MPAQLILITSDLKQEDETQANEGDEKDKQDEQKASGDEAEKPRRFPRHRKIPIVPRHRKIPIGVLNIFGQDPENIGEHANLDDLLTAAAQHPISPNQSNTLFGSVAVLPGLGDKAALDSLHGRLAGLPDQLTIVVKEGTGRA